MRMFQSVSGHSSEQSTAHFSSRPTVSQLKGISDTISNWFENHRPQRTQIFTVTNAPFLSNSNRMASRFTTIASFPSAFSQLLQCSRQHPSFSAHWAALMTKTDLNYPAYSISANSHALDVSLTRAGWKLRSHAGSRLRANFSPLTEKCEFYRLAWHNVLKYVNSDPCNERKPCVKWINDNTFLAISDFWSEKHWERAHVYTRPKTGTGKCEGCVRFPTSLEDFGRLRKTSDFFGNLRKWSCRLQKSQHSQDKNLTPLSQKKLAGIGTPCWTCSWIFHIPATVCNNLVHLHITYLFINICPRWSCVYQHSSHISMTIPRSQVKGIVPWSK